MYNATGDLLRAGRAYEQAGDLEAAAVCYRDADALPRLIEVLEKKGDHFEAGRLALERHETTRALRNLQQVDARHPRYVETCRILAEILAEQGKLDLAVQRAEESLAFGGSDGSSPASIVWYGDLLDRAGRTERALQVLEELAGRAPEHPDVGSRIEELRKKLSAARRQGAAVPSPAAGPAGVSRYEILEELGHGGMGVVHKARDRRLGRVVALKRLPATFKDHPHALELFLREARSAAALNHQNIVTIHDVDQDEDGSVFLTMELLEGTSLHHIVRRRGRLEPLDAARLAMQIAAGLQYAHENRIIHRDIKAANLFFTKNRVLKIMDFGLAKTLEEVRKASTLIGGTPFYMAPEQVRGGVVDHRVDLYAFGVTLFEMLTGTLPFRDGDVLYHHCHTAPPDPRSLAPGMPDELAELVLQLLAKDPEARPASAAEVGQRLQGIVDALRAARPKPAEPGV
jgi:tetratricopeptide (TPR) repeat protein